MGGALGGPGFQEWEGVDAGKSGTCAPASHPGGACCGKVVGQLKGVGQLLEELWRRGCGEGG